MDSIKEKAAKLRQKVEELAIMIVDLERTENVEVSINDNSSRNSTDDPRLSVSIKKNF